MKTWIAVGLAAVLGFGLGYVSAGGQRYQVAAGPGGIVRINTQTGQTWVADSNGWVEIKP